MVRDVVERLIPDASKSDLEKIRKEAIDMAVADGAVADTVTVHIDIDPQTGKVTAIATGSTEVKTAEVAKNCTFDEMVELVANDMRVTPDEVQHVANTEEFYAFTSASKGRPATRIIDKKGFIKMQRGETLSRAVKVADYKQTLKYFYEDFVTYTTDAALRPDFYVCIGPRIMDFAGFMTLQQLYTLIDLELVGVADDSEILITAVRNQIGL